MDEELFTFKQNSTISLVVGIVLILFIFGGVLGLLSTVISVWWLYCLSNRPDQTENSIRGRYEKQTRKKGKRLVRVYNPEGQQF